MCMYMYMCVLSVDIRPFKCRFCNYFARTNSQLKVHMMRHQGSHADTLAHTHTCIHSDTHAHTHTDTHACTHTHSHMHEHTHTHKMLVHTHTHPDIHKLMTHTLTHT